MAINDIIQRLLGSATNTASKIAQTATTQVAQPQQQQGASGSFGSQRTVSQPGRIQQVQQAPQAKAAASGSFGSDSEKKKDEEESMSTKGGKARQKQTWHRALDNALGTEGAGGLANELLGYTPFVLAFDTFSPEWAWNPENQAEAAKKSVNQMDFSGEYSMPSAEQLSQLSDEELEQWGADTAEGLEKSAALGMSFLPIGQGASTLSPVLKSAEKAGSTFAERQAALARQAAAQAGKETKFNPAEFRAGKNLGPAGPEVVVPEATPEAARAAAKASGKKSEEFGPAFGAQPVKPAKGKLASDAAKEISPELNYGPLQRPGIPGSRTERAVQNILGGGAEKSAAEKVLEKQAGKRQPTVEELISRGEKIPEAAAEKAPASVEDDLMNLFKGVGQEKPKAKEQLTGELDKLNKQTLELEKQISKLPEGSKEIKAARQALAEASEKKVELAEKDPEVLKRLLSGSGEGESRIMGVEERARARREMLRPGQEKRLGGKIGRILDRDVAAADRFTGNVGDMAGFYGNDLIARSQKLSPRAQSFLSEQLSPAMKSAQKPTKAQFEDIVKAVEKSERRAPKFDTRRTMAAGGVITALAAVGGVVNAVETANNSASPYTTCGGFGIDEAGNMVFSAAYGVTAEEVVATVEAAGTAVTESGEVIPGVSQEEWDNMSQREQYQKIVEADAYSRWLTENFGDEYVGDYGYEGWRDLASGGDKRALIAAMLGYSDDGQYLIPGWQEMWEQSGVDFSGDNEQDIENVYQYMWGDENIIDPDAWLTSGDTAYQGSHNLSVDEESAKRLAEYMLDQEGFDIENLDQQLFPAGYNNQDLAALIMYQNDVLNNADAFGSWTQEDLDKLSDLLGEAGDSRKYQFNDTSEELWELPSKNYGWNRWYDLWARGKEPAEYYDGADVDNVVDANLAAAYMKMIEDSTGKKIGRA